MSKKTLVLGASVKPERFSNRAIKALTKNGHNVVAIGLRSGIVGETKIETELKLHSKIDTVTLYLNPARQKMYYDYIINLNPKRVLFNPGTENTEFYSLLEENNIEKEIACTLVLLSTNQY